MNAFRLADAGILEVKISLKLEGNGHANSSSICDMFCLSDPI